MSFREKHEKLWFRITSTYLRCFLSKKFICEGLPIPKVRRQTLYSVWIHARQSSLAQSCAVLVFRVRIPSRRMRIFLLLLETRLGLKHRKLRKNEFRKKWRCAVSVLDSSFLSHTEAVWRESESVLGGGGRSQSRHCRFPEVWSDGDLSSTQLRNMRLEISL